MQLDTRYGNVGINTFLENAEIDITNGNLEINDMGTLSLRSKYGNTSINSISNGNIDFMNGNLTINNSNELELDTKYSNIELGNNKKVNISSTNDEYEIEQTDEIIARKNYGNLRVNQLNKAIEMDGTNADVRIKNVSSSLESVLLDNRYSDIRISLKNLKGYNIDFDGPYSTVYGNFDKKNKPFGSRRKMTTKTNETQSLTNTSNNSYGSGRSTSFSTGSDNGIDNYFTTSVGNGKQTKIDVRCQNCTVDFK
jgi:hypothetical protein